MSRPKNVLFIMCDQLRADYLSCAGHPALETRHIDQLAARGVRFDNAYCQAPVCGPSRMSFYTGRYMSSHGAHWNYVPLSVRERTLGDYLRPKGLRVAVCGRTHVAPDVDGMRRLGVDVETRDGKLLSEGGFEPYARHDGIHPSAAAAATLPYNLYLREHGYEGDNPWQDAANSVEGGGSGWEMRNVDRPSKVADEHSETAFVTDRAMSFITEQGSEPWCLHLSYIKPHWPYVAASPYHERFAAADVVPPVRSEGEKTNAHPVVDAFRELAVSKNFARDEVRERVVPAYMGLIQQVDHHIGRLVAHLENLGRLDDTLIVFTSDHGDYLGDHWLGDKEHFHDPSARIPLIIVDPSEQADATRGSTSSLPVEAIDVVPTCLDAVGAEPASHLLEGLSLLPVVRGSKQEFPRDDVLSELDFAFYSVRHTLGLGPHDARAYMVKANEWKYVHHKRFRPQLFDLRHDPDELVDLGDEPGYERVRSEMRDRLIARLSSLKSRVTEDDAKVDERPAQIDKRGIRIGQW